MAIIRGATELEGICGENAAPLSITGVAYGRRDSERRNFPYAC